MNSEEIVNEIKSSKKYKNISEEVIKAKVDEYLAKNKFFDKKFSIKEIKTSLHKIHGSFRVPDKKIEEYLKNKDFKSILNDNRSTRERLLDYKEIYRNIFEITGKPRYLLDLGCGLNPCSFPLMGIDLFEYYAYDINKAEMEFLNKFFETFKIHGKAQTLDLSKIENVKTLPSVDVCLMFKLIDVLEMGMKGHKYAEEFIGVLVQKCKFLVVSFATSTIGGQKMNYPQRGWIERMLTRIGLQFERFETRNELFYIITKKLD